MSGTAARAGGVAAFSPEPLLLWEKSKRPRETHVDGAWIMRVRSVASSQDIAKVGWGLPSGQNCPKALDSPTGWLIWFLEKTR